MGQTFSVILGRMDPLPPCGSCGFAVVHSVDKGTQGQRRKRDAMKLGTYAWRSQYCVVWQ